MSAPAICNLYLGTCVCNLMSSSDVESGVKSAYRKTGMLAYRMARCCVKQQLVTLAQHSNQPQLPANVSQTVKQAVPPPADNAQSTTEDSIRLTLAQHSVVVFSKSRCPFCFEVQRSPLRPPRAFPAAVEYRSTPHHRLARTCRRRTVTYAAHPLACCIHCTMLTTCPCRACHLL